MHPECLLALQARCLSSPSWLKQAVNPTRPGAPTCARNQSLPVPYMRGGARAGAVLRGLRAVVPGRRAHGAGGGQEQGAAHRGRQRARPARAVPRPSGAGARGASRAAPLGPLGPLGLSTRAGARRGRRPVPDRLLQGGRAFAAGRGAAQHSTQAFVQGLAADGVFYGPGRACRECGGGAARQASPRRPPEARTLTAGAVRAQGAEAARARLQRAPGPGGMWSQDTTAESRRQLVELLPLVRHSNPAPRA